MRVHLLALLLDGLYGGEKKIGLCLRVLLLALLLDGPYGEEKKIALLQLLRTPR